MRKYQLIIGRTGRQGEAGTYQLIVSIESLEKFQIKSEIIEKPLSQRYKCLHEKRFEHFELQYKESIKFVASIKEEHEKSKEFLDSIFSEEKDFKKINNFLLQENSSFAESSTVKTLILLDATGSMINLLDKTKKTISKMFKRITQVLEKDKIKESFEIKIAVYRNYSSPEDEIYQESVWERKPQNLIKFLESVEASGGWGNEAIEIGFYHANREEDLSQIILIGDACPNTIEEIQTKRNDARFKSIWDNSAIYKDPTDYKKELEILMKKKIKVHTFYVHDNAKEIFTEISNFTNGSFKFLNINSDDGSTDLMNLVNIEILNSIGGEKLVKSYEKIFHTKPEKTQ